MAIDTLELTRLLALGGLLSGATAYYLLIRRRRHGADEMTARMDETSRLRATARLRRLQRRDER